jgi:hypothetical protein
MWVRGIGFREFFDSPGLRKISWNTIATMSICYQDKFTLDKWMQVLYEENIVSESELILVVHYREHASLGYELGGDLFFAERRLLCLARRIFQLQRVCARRVPTDSFDAIIRVAWEGSNPSLERTM